MLKGKNAIITGGTRGIGKAIALCFVKQGASVAIFGTNKERGEAARQEIANEAPSDAKVKFYQVNVSSKEEVKQGVEAVLADFGCIDILVNNAGITRDNLLMRLSPEEWEEVIATNLGSIFHMCQAIIRPMLKAKGGKIINITSIVGLTGNAGQTNYAASKAGVIGFTKSLAKEVASRQIAVNCIAPGFITTDMTDGLPEKVKEGYMNTIPMKKFGQGEDIAHAALFLASDLSNYVTGQVLTVDGGLTM